MKDLDHNPQPYRQVHARRAALLTRTLRSYAGKVKDKRMAAFLLECGDTIENLQLEQIAMARSFTEATTVVVSVATQDQTDKAALTDQLATATATIATLTANQQTPDVLAAQQSIIDLSEKLSPSAPPADPSAGSNGANVTLPGAGGQ